MYRYAEEAAAAAEAGTAVKSEATLRFEAVKDGIDTFLLYDFFVILFILAYLIIGGAESSQLPTQLENLGL